MKYSAPLLALSAIANAAHFSKEQYESGEVHQRIIDMKNAQWDALEAAGALNSSQYPSWKDWDQLPKSVKKGSLKCKRGVAVAEKGNPDQTFRCKNMDLYDFMNHESLGGGEADPRYPNRRGSSVWGWVGPKGRQIGLIGQHTGTAFVEIDKKGKLTYLGRLPAQDPLGSSWREIRVLNNLAIIGSEAVGHNVQIFDLNKVAAIDPKSPVTFDATTDLEGLFDDLPIGRAHNVVIDWDNEYAIAVGAQPRNQTCAAGLEYINLDDPTNPYKPGCASSDGYTHDAQCVTYNGPDRRYKGRNICVAYNEDSITVWDSTNKANSKMLGRLEYPGATYTHQGWWTERNWHQFVLLNDELDEVEGVVADGVPITHIIDLTDLTKPKWTGTFQSTDGEIAVDHNLYIEDGVMFQSNYGAGVWVTDVRSISKYPDGSRIKHLAFFDMHPEDDATGGSLGFVGTWGNFQFPSGFILANTFERGAYVLRVASGRGRNGGKGFGGKSK